MSRLDVARLIHMVARPADSFDLQETKADKHGMMRRKFTFRWGNPADSERLGIVITTSFDPVREDDSSLTVYYAPTSYVVMKGGVPHYDHYTGVGMYSFNYHEDRPTHVRDLDLALRPLSNPVAPAPCVSGF